ncbi:unnamed protein product, partial [Protopolystoma xenopodis]
MLRPAIVCTNPNISLTNLFSGSGSAVASLGGATLLGSLNISSGLSSALSNTSCVTGFGGLPVFSTGQTGQVNGGLGSLGNLIGIVTSSSPLSSSSSSQLPQASASLSVCSSSVTPSSAALSLASTGARLLSSGGDLLHSSVGGASLTAPGTSFLNTGIVESQQQQHQAHQTLLAAAGHLTNPTSGIKLSASAASSSVFTP